MSLALEISVTVCVLNAISSMLNGVLLCYWINSWIKYYLPYFVVMIWISESIHPVIISSLAGPENYRGCPV